MIFIYWFTYALVQLVLSLQQRDTAVSFSDKSDKIASSTANLITGLNI